MVRKPYITKRRKSEFKSAYEKIGQLNQYISSYEIEIDVHIKNSNFEEAIGKQKIVNEMKIELLEMGKLGWDIDYRTPMTSGLYVKVKTPEL
jgi:hypothetical protein